MVMGMKNAALACALLSTCNFLAAAPLEPLALAGAGESDFFSELPVVLTVTRMPQAMKDVPGFVTLIDAEDIRYSGARDLADLLRRVPGFNVSQAPDGAPTANYHGMGEDFAKGLQVLVDGRSQYSPIFEGGVVWSLIDISLADIARIEVLRGSNSPAYGSNAFMGVVNIVTRNPAETRGVMASANHGDGVSDHFARLGFGGAGWNARLSAERDEDQGLPTFDDSRVTERYNLQLDTSPSRADRLKFTAGASRLSLRRGVPTDPLQPLRWVDGANAFGQVNWEHTWSPESITEAFYNQVRQSTDDVIPVAVGPFRSTLNNSGTADRNELSLQHTLLLPTVRLLGGFSYRSDRVSHDFFYGSGRELRQWVGRTFGQLEWRPSELATINLGATYEDDSLAGKVLLPRLALNLHVVKDHTLKLIVGKSQRNPTLYETRSNERLIQAVSTGIPAGALILVERSSSGRVKPTEVVSKEVGYFGEFKSFGLTLDARYFREDVSNWIRTAQDSFPASAPGSATCPIFNASVSPPCGVYDDFYNVIDARINGWETQIVWRPSRATTAGLGFAETRIKADWVLAGRGADEAVMRFINGSAPRHSVSLWARQRLIDRLTLSAAYYQVDTMRWTRNSKAAEYDRLDWRVSYDFRLGPARAELAWTVRSARGDHVESRGLTSDGAPWVPPETIEPQHFASLRVEF
jgi:iron complex outermembrane recepter protein